MSSMAVGPFPMRLLLRNEDAQQIHLVFFPRHFSAYLWPPLRY